MRNMNARILASLLWLKARYEFLTNRPLGRVWILFFVIGIGVFFTLQPAQACDWTDIGCHIRSAILMIAGIIASFLAELIAIVLEYMIPVMLYNSFSTSPVVTAGWALVRDTVNMFFVIVLIVIAFGTIFGHSKFKWQQQVPKLLIFAVVINFSKTLAGIMIDFGQVIMLTFANALREIAAGNIIELFGLNKVNSFGAGVQGKPAADWDLVMASLAAVFILAWVLVIMILLFAILLYRIVALWILIVLAPLAWFAGGAKDILQSNAYADWWAQFKCLVAIGPVVTFFLWLALSVAGAGAAAEGFDSGAVNLGNSANFFTEIFELQHFMSMVIGSAMIMAGLQTAQQICSVMSGTFLGKQLGKAAAFGPGAMQFAKGAGLKTTAWGARKVGAGARAAGRAGLRGTGILARSTTGKKIGLDKLTTEGRAERARARAASAGTGVLGRWRARRNLELAGKLEGRRTEQIARVGESFGKQGAEVKADLLNRFAKSPPGTLGKLGGTQDEVLARFADALGNKDVMEKLEKSGDIRSLWKNYGSQMETTFKGDKATMDKIQSFKKKHAHLTGAASEIKTADDLENLSDEALGDKTIRDRIANMGKVKVKDGKKTVEMDAMAAIMRGKFGVDKKRLIQGGYDAFDDDQLRRAEIDSVAESASLPTVQRAAQLALQDRNVARTSEVVSSLVTQYKNPSVPKIEGEKEEDTRKRQDEKRFEIAGILDNLKAQFSQQLSSGDLKGAYAKELKSLQNTFDAERKSAEMSSAHGNTAGQPTGPNYGRIPPVQQIGDVSKFYSDHFANASDGRVTNAQGQLDAQVAQKQEEVSKGWSKFSAEMDKSRSSLNAELVKLNSDLADLSVKRRPVLRAAEQRAQAASTAFSDQAKAKDQEIKAIDQRFNRGGVTDLTELRSMRDQLTALQQEKAALEEKARNATSTSAVNQDPELVEFDKDVNEKRDRISEIYTQQRDTPRSAEAEALLAAMDQNKAELEQIKNVAEAFKQEVERRRA